ncbi:sporulation histidine kinase inhibitor Sda [Cytobacillus solani]|uniref:sporulation histidine kinase inhibitor Sda n=1 Tax=Cytobacillus solani TaxID=1637975 RepID=UPI0009E9C213|nr:sporulation histidine kinase inhibitor Sda [Cytobacillus solani]USK54628.1 sporulation histidine kinase inhibitor Sda [Cytobacillus solani]
MSSLEKLPDLLLVETYYKAVAIDLEPKFIEFLLFEINKRGLEVYYEKQLN